MLNHLKIINILNKTYLDCACESLRYVRRQKDQWYGTCKGWKKDYGLERIRGHQALITIRKKKCEQPKIKQFNKEAAEEKY